MIQNPKQTLCKFLGGFLVLLIVSAFLAPWLFSFLPFKFDRILRRLIMVGAILLALRLVRVSRESFGRLGLTWGRGSARGLGPGFVFGVGLVATVSLIQWGLGARFVQIHETDVEHWIGLFFKALGAGAVIATLEEFFFRGFLFLTLKDIWNTKGSLVVTNLIYALVHFFPKSPPWLGPVPTVLDSFRLYGAMVTAPWSEPGRILAVLGLFFFGLLLSFVFLRSGSLFPVIALHAGAVSGLKMNRRFLPEISEKMTLWTGSKNLYDGIAGGVVLAVSCLVVGKFLKDAGAFGRGGKKLLLTLLLTMLPCGVLAHAQSQAKAEKMIYSFTEKLAEAQVSQVGKEESVKGVWKGYAFHFEKLRGSDILVTGAIPVEGKTQSAVWVRPAEEHEVDIVYPSVPVGRRLQLFFAAPDSAFQRGKSALIEFEVWVGRKKLLGTRIHTPGWKERNIDLLVPFLLQRNYRFRFKIRAVDRERQNLIFYGHLQ